MNVRPNTIYFAAAVVSLLALVVVTLPAWRGPVVLDPALALEWLTFVALAWGTAFAAASLYELKAARLSEFAPRIALQVRRERAGERLNWAFNFHNVGKGYATDVAVFFWDLDDDGRALVPHKLREVPSTLAPGEQASDRETECEWWRYPTQDVRCHFAIEVVYRDAMRTRQVERWGFRVVPGGDTAIEVEAPPLKERDAKYDAVVRRIRAIERERGLQARGWNLLVRAADGRIGITLIRGGRMDQPAELEATRAMAEIEEIVSRLIARGEAAELRAGRGDGVVPTASTPGEGQDATG